MKTNMINTLKLINRVEETVDKTVSEDIKNIVFCNSSDRNMELLLNLDFNKYTENSLKGVIAYPHNKELLEDKEVKKYDSKYFEDFLSRVPYENSKDLGYENLYSVYVGKNYNINYYGEIKVNERVKYLKIKEMLLNRDITLETINDFYDNSDLKDVILGMIFDNTKCILDSKFYNVFKYSFIYNLNKTDDKFKNILKQYKVHEYLDDKYLSEVEKIYLKNTNISNYFLLSLYYSIIETFKLVDLIDKIGLDNLEKLQDKIQDIIPNGVMYFNNYEVNRLLHSEDINYENPYETIYGKDAYILKFFKHFEDNQDFYSVSTFLNFVKKMHKKEVFLDVLYNNLDVIYDKYNDKDFKTLIKTFDKLDKFSNLNQFTNDLMKDLLDNCLVLGNDKSSFDGLNSKITPEEYILLYRLFNVTNGCKVVITLYNDLIKNKVKYNNRVILLKQLLNMNIKDRILIENYDLFAQGLTLEQLYRKYNIDKKDWTFTEKFFYITNYNLLGYLDLENLNIELIINKFDSIKQYLIEKLPLKNIVDNIYETSILFLKHFCNLTDDFILKNKENIINFCNKGLVEVVESLEKDYLAGQNTLQLKNLKLIVAAELSNQLKRIKYVQSDYVGELGIEVSENVRENWEKCISSSSNKYDVKECDSFEDLIRIGELPNKTCIFWRNERRKGGDFYGMYNYTLLSNFDTNKKVIYAFDKAGNKIARSIIRLTKVTDITKKSKGNGLGFINVLEENVEEKVNEEVSTNDENLVLFLERPYTSIQGYEENQILSQMLELAVSKAKELGIRLMISNEYLKAASGKYDYNVCNNIKIYISKSKNGDQYLDSLGGRSNAESGGTYYSTYNLCELELNK